MPNANKTNFAKVDPIQSAKREAVYERGIPFSELPRIADLVSNPDDAAQVKIEFYYDGKGKVALDVNIEATMEITKDDGESTLILDRSISDTLQPLTSEEVIAGVESDYDTCEIINNSLNLFKIVGDSLLLSLPMQFDHESSDVESHN